MERVTGIGGLFFRSKDPEALGRWYRDQLGIDLVPTSADGQPWQQEAGITIFAPFPAETDYFAADKPFMLNFRVSDMDAMMAQLRAGGTEVTERDGGGLGRFAHLADPEGTPIELWEPPKG